MRQRSLLFCAAVFACALCGAYPRQAAEAAGDLVVFADDFEHGNTSGWTMRNGDPETVGDWIIDTPVQTLDNEGLIAQPGFCVSGDHCAITGQNPTGHYSQGDVDFGVVWLVTPILDLSGAETAELTYFRWYYLRDLNVDTGDYFRVQACPTAPCPLPPPPPGNPSPWVTLENLDNSARHNAWTHVTIPLHEYIPLTASVQIRFAASDRRTVGTVLEGAVDDVEVSGTFDCSGDGICPGATYCNAQGECVAYGNGDFDGDGDVDLADCARFMTCYGQPAGTSCSSGNLTGDLIIEGDDLAALISLLGGPS